jgi:hypothetical protein
MWISLETLLIKVFNSYILNINKLKRYNFNSISITNVIDLTFVTAQRLQQIFKR